MIYNNITELIGNTPIIRVEKFSKAYGLDVPLLVKAERFNPAGSVKDRVGYEMICDAEKKGILKQGSVIIEPTSGNTGIGLAMAATVKGYHLILTMPDSMSKERRDLLKAYGAELVLTPASEGMQGAVKKASELASKYPDSFIPSQFSNPANPIAHEKTTAKEIIEDTDGRIAGIVAGVGTGGTLCGTGRALKVFNGDIKVIAVEPADSPLISKGEAGAHTLQGIGANFVPENYDPTVVDRVITVTGDEAADAVRMLVKTEGILCGISSGAALVAAVKMQKEGSMLPYLAILPDGGEKYLSTGLFD